jgi:hypothetical protein
LRFGVAAGTPPRLGGGTWRDSCQQDLHGVGAADRRGDDVAVAAVLAQQVPGSRHVTHRVAGKPSERNPE